MNDLKTIFMASGLILSVSLPVAFASESVSEKVSSKANSASRSVKKGVNRTKEAVCMKGDMKCAGEKVKNRAGEAKDATVDKAKELKNRVD